MKRVLLVAGVFIGPTSLFFTQDAAAQSGYSEKSVSVVSSSQGDREIFFTIMGSVDHRFRTDIDGGGRFSSTRVGTAISARSDLTHDFDLTFGIGYEFDHYRFKGDTGFGGITPWKDIHTLSFGLIFSADLTSDWNLFAGPVMQFSNETDARWKDGFIGGGVIGTSVAISDELTLGGGFGIVSEIEGSSRFFPIIIVDWDITDRLKLTSRGLPSASGDIGLELLYDWGGGFETALGGGYFFRRFRLEDGGLAPRGVGQNRGFPIWGRLGYHVNPNFSLNLYAGVVVEGDLRLESESGITIGREDYDPSPFVGISASLRF